MTQKSVHAVGVLIPRAVVMKRERAMKITSEEKRGRQTCRPGANHDTVVQVTTIRRAVFLNR